MPRGDEPDSTDLRPKHRRRTHRNAFDSIPEPARHRHVAFDVGGNGKAIALRLGKQVLMVTSWGTLGMHTTRNLIAAYLENLQSDELGFILGGLFGSSAQGMDLVLEHAHSQHHCKTQA